jgi:hypothetical protein
MRARTGIAVLSVNAMIKHAKTNPRLYEDMVELGYSDSTFPSWWYSPARDGTEGQQVEQQRIDAEEGRTGAQEGEETAGKRTQTQAEAGYAPTPPDKPRPKEARPTRLPVREPAPASDALPASAPASAASEFSDFELSMLKDQAVTEITTGAHAAWRNKECLLMFTSSF